MNKVFVLGAFDDIRSKDIRFLHEASRLGELHVLLFSDELFLRLSQIKQETKGLKFPLQERLYFLQSIRYVTRVHVLSDDQELRWLFAAHKTEKSIPDRSTLIKLISDGDMIAVRDSPASEVLRNLCEKNNLNYRLLSEQSLNGFPYEIPKSEEATCRGGSAKQKSKKVIVTGSFDWFHSGHIRFFEQAAMYGQLIAVVGNDANIRLLKGAGHPLYGEEERRYTVGSIRYVAQALISTGSGWLDAEPEILRLKPDIYIVNEDGDRPEKRSFCNSHDIEYLVLKRTPREGLPARSSTDLRGF